MNILIDLRWMTIGRAGGMEQMAFELVASIAGVNRVDRFWLYCPIATFDEWQFGAAANVELIDSDQFQLISERGYCDSYDPSRYSKRLGFARRDGLGREGNRIVDIDLIHSVGGYIAEELRSYRNVLTIHDLQHVHFPENFEESELGARRANYQGSIDESVAVVCVSESVRKDVLENFDVDPEKVVTVWNIPSGAALPELPDSLVQKTLTRLGLDSGYLFFPSHAWSHKNHDMLIQAFAKAKRSIPNLRLVLTGGELGADHPAAKRIRDLSLAESVKHLGFRTPLEVRCLYQGAGALVYPSLFEGFGMPVAEAILAGTPVVCSDIIPLREIGGDAIVTFDPRSPNAIAEALLKVLGDSQLGATLLESAAEQRKAFSPVGIARKTCDLYRSAVGLAPIEYDSYVPKRDLRREKAQHWSRVCDNRLLEGRRIGGAFAWLASFWNSPSMAMRLRDRYSRRTQISDPSSISPFNGRYGDSWIGSDFEDWILVPNGSSRLDLRFQAPPEPFGSELIIKVSIDGNSVCSGAFDGKSELSLIADLPDQRDDLVELRIECSGSFVPKKEGFSEDSRELSVKLVEIRWS
jgi:glycosyltransferase involved in cell wall biosynthesis